MATESKTVKLKLFGQLEWAKVFPTNIDRAEWNKETDGEFKVTMILDEENQEKLNASDSMRSVRDGKVTFSRPHKGKHDWQGGQPTVVDVKGQPWSLDADGYIGNGSTGMVVVSIYPAGSGRYGTRLESIQVVDHVKYESEGSSSHFTDLSALSSGASSSAPSTVSVASTEMDDVIPF